MTLLIVEDNTSVRRLLKSLLADLAAGIYECGNGAEALKAYATYRPDWVLMDIKMAELDGLTATQQLKAVWPAARIVIVTAYDDAEWRAAAQGAGACGYVVKENLLDLRRILLAA